MATELDLRIDALFAVDPATFTAERDALAKELRAAGDREGADRVKALRRPGRIAAALNRLARHDAAGLDAALAAEDRLADVQAGVLAGTADGDELRASADAASDAVAALSPDPAIRAALRLAARSADAREDLVRGRLTRDPEPDPEAGLFGGGQVTAARPRARSGRAAAAKPAPPPADELAAVRERRRKAEVDRRAAEREEQLAAALERLQSAEAAVASARQGLDAARARRDAAGENRDALSERVAEARKALAALESDLAALDADLGAAEEVVASATEAVTASEERLAEAKRVATEALEPPSA